jgi:hypothetical protein
VTIAVHSEGHSRWAQRVSVGAPVYLAACCAILLGAPVASAQTASPEDMASARLLGTEGVRLADSGDCVAAVVKLAAAEKLFHAPTTLERLGECQVKNGQIVAGTESLNRVSREPLSSNPPPAFLAAKQRAQQALTAALGRIGKLRIHVEGAPADKVTVTVDGANVPSALFDADRPTDPGAHEVKATATGYKVATATVSVQEGSGAAVTLKLESDPNAGAVLALVPVATEGSPAVAVTPATLPPVPDTSGTRRGVAFGALGVGGAGVVLGSVFGILALNMKSKLDSECPTKTTCPSLDQSDITALSTRATVSTIGFSVGVAGVGLGVVLLATSHGAEKPAAATARVTPWIGFGAAGVRGSFE